MNADLEVAFPASLGTPYPFERVGPNRWRFEAAGWVPERDLTVDW